MCDYSELDILNALDFEPPEPNISAEDLEAYALKVYTGAITTETLDVAVYAQTINYLMGAIIKGYGGLADDFVFGTGLNITATGIENNIWRFSAAKQYQQVRILSKLASKAVPFEEFKKVADVVLPQYNKNYLKTEYLTSVLQSQAAREWVDFQENDEIQFLKYHTQKDGRVRAKHKALDGVTLPKNHSFWNDYTPANGWRCRCFVTGTQTTRKETNLSKKTLPKFGTKDFPKEFKMNAGKDKIVFKENHPYFKVSRGDADLKKRNFNLPLPV
jgi:SPP1 gp7 family putative phage head morphogenesis protein